MTERTARRPEPAPEEAALVARARNGDVQAFGTLHRRTVGRVHAICLRMTQDPSWAEELVQDAYVRAWERLGSFEGKSAFGSWLHRVAVNVVLDAKRSRLRRAIREEEVASAPRANADKDARIDLERAIAALPPGARAIYVLHDVEGYTHEEIAALAGVASGTSKAQLHRARRLLRRSLGGGREQ